MLIKLQHSLTWLLLLLLILQYDFGVAQIWQRRRGSPPQKASWPGRFQMPMRGPGMPAPGGPDENGIIWHTGWIPANNFQKPKEDAYIPGFPSNKMSPTFEARQYLERFYPEIHLHDQTPNFPVMPPWNVNNPQHPAPGMLSRPPYFEDPSTFPEVVASCEPRSCYLSCRMSLVGAGKCSKSGCICYLSFFDYDGSPTSLNTEEDYIWYSLSPEEKLAIRRAQQSGLQGETTKPPYIRPSSSTARTTTTKRPITQTTTTATTRTTATMRTTKAPYTKSSTTTKPSITTTKPSYFKTTTSPSWEKSSDWLFGDKSVKKSSIHWSDQGSGHDDDNDSGEDFGFDF